MRTFVFVLLMALPPAAAAQTTAPSGAAGGRTATLAQCLADNTSGKDRKDLARWIFVAMTVHPQMRDVAASDLTNARDQSSRTMAALVTRLLTSDCLTETRAAVSGNAADTGEALKIAFENLGKVAMQELMTDQGVQGALNDFARHIDQARFSQSLQP